MNFIHRQLRGYLETLWSERGGFRDIDCENMEMNIDVPNSEATFLALKVAEVNSDLSDLMTEERLQKTKSYFLRAKEDVGFNYIPSDVIAQYEPYITMGPTLESTRQVMQILKFEETYKNKN